VLARPAGSAESRVLELAHELMAVERELEVGAVGLGPAPRPLVLEGHRVEPEGAVDGSERPPDGSPPAGHETVLVRTPERQLVLGGPVSRGVEAPPLPRRLVEEAETGGAYGEGLLGDLRRVDGPGERRTVDDVPETEGREELPAPERQVWGQE